MCLWDYHRVDHRSSAVERGHGAKLAMRTNAQNEPKQSRSNRILSSKIEFGSPRSGGVFLTVASRLFLPYLYDMEVDFTAEQEAQLGEIAAKSGTDPKSLVKDAAMRLLQEEARFRSAVRVAQADRGEFIEEDDMDARFEQMLRS